MEDKTTFGEIGDLTNNVDRFVGSDHYGCGGGAKVVAAPAIGRAQSLPARSDVPDDVAVPPLRRTIDEIFATTAENDEPKIPPENTTPPVFLPLRPDTFQRHTHLQRVARCIQPAVGGGGWC